MITEAAPERAELGRLKSEVARALNLDREAAKKTFIKEQIDRLIAHGATREGAQRTVEHRCNHVLHPGVVLHMDDQSEVSVADILADPDRFDGATLADPIESVPYGYNCAIIQMRERVPSIFSFAHGGTRYALRHDLAAMEAAIRAADKADVASLFCRLAIANEPGTAEEKMLAKLAGERSKVGMRAIEEQLKKARAEQQAKDAQARRDRNAAESRKVRLPVPMADAEAGPVMETWDDILSHIEAAEPPMLDVVGWPVEVQCREPHGLHELTAMGANNEEPESSRLPSPKQYLITHHDPYSLEIELGDHLTFLETIKDGERAVGAPFRFLTHWLKYKRSLLPRVCAVASMPLVLSDGTILRNNGLDRVRRFVMRSDPALLSYIPRRDLCSADAVYEAFRFLVDEWLVDVEI